jgi:hypothetical protein
VACAKARKGMKRKRSRDGVERAEGMDGVRVRMVKVWA